MKYGRIPVAVGWTKSRFNRWDLIATLLILGFLTVLAAGSRGALQPLAAITAAPLSLDPAHLPRYAAQTIMRMLLAMALSLLFTLTYATWAAKSKRAGMLLIPILDILQSVPILGFLSVAVVFFLSLTPGRAFGAECAAIFAIFTSQAWNMAFGFYQSLRAVPKELVEASRNLHFSPWMRFWKLEVPFAVPQLAWNMMISMAGGWFFVVASESISVGETQISLPGIGSYIAVAIAQKNMGAIAWAIITMVIVLLLTDQLFFRPLLCWSQRFVADQDPDKPPPRSWMLTMLRRSVLITTLAKPLATLWKMGYRPQAVSGQPSRRFDKIRPDNWQQRMDQLWLLFLLAICMLALWSVGHYVTRNLPVHELGLVALRGLATMARVFAMLALATLIWVPVGVWIGTNLRLATTLQPIVQLVSAFPANLLFPVVASIIVSLRLDAELWLSPLLILGAQWYILFNVIAGAMAMPRELKDVSRNLQLKGWLWWRTLGLPAIAPFYITGAITAAGGAWNASIVAEVVSWGDERLMAHGLGSYISMATTQGDFDRLVLGVATMSLFVVLVNQLLWRPLYRYAERRFQFN